MVRHKENRLEVIVKVEGERGKGVMKDKSKRREKKKKKKKKKKKEPGDIYQWRQRSGLPSNN